MKAVARPRAAVPGVAHALQGLQMLLRLERSKVKHRMGVVKLGNDFARCNLAQRVERDHHALREWQRLEHIEQVVQAYAGALTCLLARATRGAFVVPRGPSAALRGQHGCVGVQHGAVGLVAHSA